MKTLGEKENLQKVKGKLVYPSLMMKVSREDIWPQKGEIMNFSFVMRWEMSSEDNIIWV